MTKITDEMLGPVDMAKQRMKKFIDLTDALGHLVDVICGAHTIDIIVRRDGEARLYEGDFLKQLPDLMIEPGVERPQELTLEILDKAIEYAKRSGLDPAYGDQEVKVSRGTYRGIPILLEDDDYSRLGYGLMRWQDAVELSPEKVARRYGRDGLVYDRFSDGSVCAYANEEYFNQPR